MLSEAVSGQWDTFKLATGAGYFRTTDYDSRLYVYERGPLYSFSVPAYFGEGLRLHLMVQTNINRHLSLTAKLGYTHYFDRSTIGSNLQQINGASQTDLDLQARWKF